MTPAEMIRHLRARRAELQQWIQAVRLQHGETAYVVMKLGHKPKHRFASNPAHVNAPDLVRLEEAFVWTDAQEAGEFCRAASNYDPHGGPDRGQDLFVTMTANVAAWNFAHSLDRVIETLEAL